MAIKGRNIGSYNLSWDNSDRSSTIFNSLVDNSTKYSDISLISRDGDLFQAHKIILASSSSYFDSVLTKSSQLTQGHLVLCLPEISGTILQSFLDFIYKGQTEVSKNELDSFTKAAQKYKIRGLTDEDTNDMVVNDQNEDFTQPIKTELQETFDETIGNNEVYEEESQTLEEREMELNENGYAVIKMGTKKCPYCRSPKYMRSYDELVSHISEKHKAGVKFQCSRCVEVFDEVPRMQLHAKSHQPGRQPKGNLLRCEFCDYKTTKTENYERHMKYTYHENNKLQKPLQENVAETGETPNDIDLD